MTPAPTLDTAKSEQVMAEAAIDFNSPVWHAIEIWLGWRRYDLAQSILSERDDTLRGELHGMAKMCRELIKMGESKRS